MPGMVDSVVDDGDEKHDDIKILFPATTTSTHP